MNDTINSIVNWPFLEEPLYRWGLFFLALICMAFAWNSILSLMRSVTE